MIYKLVLKALAIVHKSIETNKCIYWMSDKGFVMNWIIVRKLKFVNEQLHKRNEELREN